MSAKNMEDAEGPLRFTVFGPVQAWRGDVQLKPGPARQRSVLAALLLHANRPVGRERLIEAVWGDPAPAFAVNQLQKYISALRRVLEPDRAARSPSGVVAWSEGGYVLRTEPDSLDLTAFEARADRGRKALAQGNPRLAAAELEEALSLWSGPALANVSSTVLDMERDRLAELRTAVLAERIQADLELGRHGRLVPELTQLVAEFPLHERFASLLMLALFRTGRQAEALAVYETTRGVLAEELGIDPGPELQQRHRQILTSDAALALDTSETETDTDNETDAGTETDAGAQARPARAQAPAPSRTATAEELALRLDDARQMQIKAGQEARTAYALVFWLLQMVNSLQERVDRLETEKRRQEPGPELQQELAASHERLKTARKQLTEARREREKAEEIQLATQRLVEERLHEREADLRPRPQEAGSDHTRFTSAEDLGLAPLYEVDHFLEASAEQLEKQSAQLDELSGELDLTTSAEHQTEPEAAPKVVRGHLADGAAATDPVPRGHRGLSGDSTTSNAGSPEDRDARAGRPPAARPARAYEGTGRHKWLWTGSLVAAATLALLPLTFHERSEGLDYDVGNYLPVKTRNSSTPSYLFQGVSARPPSAGGDDDLWATFVTPASPAFPFTYRLKTKLILSVPEGAVPDPDCPSDQTAGVVWTLTVDGGNEVASGTLIKNNGESAPISRDLPPETETITLAASASDECGYDLRLEKPAIHYSGW